MPARLTVHRPPRASAALLPLLLLLLAACQQIREMRVELDGDRELTPLDCGVNLAWDRCEADRHGDGRYESFTCVDDPPETAVHRATIHACEPLERLPGRLYAARLRRAACAAGADTLRYELSVTHACHSGGTLRVFEAYRVNPEGVDDLDVEVPVVIRRDELHTRLAMPELPARLADVRRWLQSIGAANDCSRENLYWWQDELGVRNGDCSAGPIELEIGTLTLAFRLEQRVRDNQTEELVVDVEIH